MKQVNHSKPMNIDIKISPNSKLLMIGDSVTDCERARPVGEGLFNALGNGYVRDINSILSALLPEHRLRVVNLGSSGNTVRDLKDRWESDVIQLTPDWLSVMIGINDVWRQFDMPLQAEAGVPLDEYSATLDLLLAKVRPKLAGLVLMSPFYIEDNSSDRMRARMDEYGYAVKALAQKHNAIFVDTQAAFNQALKHNHSAYLAWDRVHPSAVGHMILARAFLNGIGLEF